MTFLGSGDAFGSGGRLQTCMLLDSGDERILLDCGATSVVALKRHNLPTPSIRAVLITHLHGDHFAGLPFLLLDARFSRRKNPLIIAGPPGTETRVRQATEILFPGSSASPLGFDVEYVELHLGEPAPFGAASVTPYEVVHPAGAPSYALRVELERHVITFSGDTEWTDSLVEAARDADLFVCECYFYDRKGRYHLDYLTLRERLAAARPNCGRVILTHLSPEMLERAKSGELEFDTAYDGMVVRLSDHPHPPTSA